MTTSTTDLLRPGTAWSSLPPAETSASVLFVHPGITCPGWASMKPGGSNEATYGFHGFMHLSACLKARGHLVRLIDLRTLRGWPDFEHVLAGASYDLAVVGHLSIDRFAAACAVRILKNVHPSRLVIVGGVDVSVSGLREFPPRDLPSAWLPQAPHPLIEDFLRRVGEPAYDPARWPRADCVVHGEGEAAICVLAETAAAGEKLLAFVDAGIQPTLVDLPEEDRFLFNEPAEAATPLLPWLPKPFMTVSVGRGCPYRCLAGDTLVNTVEGQVPIKDLAQQDRSVELFTHGTGRSVYEGMQPERAEGIGARLISSGENLVRIHFDDSGWIDCTPDHEFLVQEMDSQWPVRADRLTLGSMRVVGIDKNGKEKKRKVTGITILPGLHDVYCLEVPRTGWFYANDVLVKNCTYCSVGAQASSMRPRLGSVPKLIESMHAFAERNGGKVGSLMVHDDILMYPKWIDELCDAIMHEFGYVPWWCQVRADFIVRYKALFAKAARAGMVWASIGVESGSDRMLKLIDKRTTAVENLEACRFLQDELGVNVFCNWMLGIPGETPEDVRLTADLVTAIRPAWHSASIYCDYPGTPMSHRITHDGLRLPTHYARTHYPWQWAIKGVDYSLALEARSRVCSAQPNNPKRPKFWVEK